MPLKRGTSKATRQENIREMIASGHEPKQAVAAAYRQSRTKSRDKHSHEVQKSLDGLSKRGRI